MTAYELWKARQRGQDFTLEGPDKHVYLRMRVNREIDDEVYHLILDWINAAFVMQRAEMRIEAAARAERCGHLFDGGSVWCEMPKGHPLPHITPYRIQ